MDLATLIMDPADDAMTTTQGTDEPIYLMGLRWPLARERIEPQKHINTPIPRERAIVRVPSAQESGGLAPIPAAPAAEDVIDVPVRPIVEALDRKWRLPLLPLQRAPPVPNEELHD
jgi:hypothetical protein